ncbi:MAG: transcriptional repressor LexA [Armatimonadetes bacterium]|nr:transcriptional repressor LexA [Armatimonadota bacterium]MBS1702768.1 transcriptional repressor LexA [Armatimonadota bacterium]MBS1727577.1 transcriptional repressor LexA [Armatimonadota bacterium]
MAKGLTKRQEEILDFILQYVESEGYPPSIREIGQKFEIGSLRGVTVHLDALERKSYISRSNTPRSIKLTHPKFTPGNSRVTMLPLVGTIAAGTPVLAQEEIEGMIPVPSEMVRNVDGAFLLRVKGDSMIGDGIMPRDLVVIRPQKTFHGNDVMAVRVGEEATVKRIHKTPKGVQLLSSNPDYAPIEVDPTETEVIGKVVGLFRDYEGMSF